MVYLCASFYKKPFIDASIMKGERGKNMSTILALFSVFLSLHSHVILSSDPDPVQDFCIPHTTLNVTRTIRSNIMPCKNLVDVIPEDFIFSGIKHPGNFSDTGLSAISVSPKTFPGLNTQGMSFVRADLKVNGVNVPHLHPRATEITYVIQGRVYSGFVDSTNRVFARVIEKGEVMVFPRGLVHFQMNVGRSTATVFGSFNSQNPGMQKIPSIIFGSGINDKLLEKAFGLNSKQIGKIRKKFLPKI